MKTITTIFCVLLLASCTSNKINEVKKVVEEIQKTTLSGDFKDGSHPTSGKVETDTDKTKLSFTNFKTSKGPILEVWVASTRDPKNNDEYHSLGILKGLDGNYTYDLPKNIDYTKYKYVLIWCVEFKVLFGYAELK